MTPTIIAAMTIRQTPLQWPWHPRRFDTTPMMIIMMTIWQNDECNDYDMYDDTTTHDEDANDYYKDDCTPNDNCNDHDTCNDTTTPTITATMTVHQKTIATTMTPATTLRWQHQYSDDYAKRRPHDDPTSMRPHCWLKLRPHIYVNLKHERLLKTTRAVQDSQGQSLWTQEFKVEGHCSRW